MDGFSKHSGCLLLPKEHFDAAFCLLSYLELCCVRLTTVLLQSVQSYNSIHISACYFDILFDKIAIVSLVSLYLINSCEEKGGPGSGVSSPPLE